MVTIPAGTFIMGAPPELANQPNSERPEHRVTIPQFAVSKNEITFIQWEACVAAGGCDDTTRSAYGNTDRGNGYRPLVNIDWNDAQTYVRWLSQRTGQGYRLLSEAEWEYAARAGTTTEFATGASIAPSQANFGGQLGETRPVGSYPPNAFGLHDMHGNVAEWVEDCWNESYSGAPLNGSAWIAGDCTQHVIRGGYHWDNDYNLRSSQRHPDVATATIAGIRVARIVSVP
jgi:formylglycine-generating enzyme required for sulfatase activity